MPQKYHHISKLVLLHGFCDAHVNSSAIGLKNTGEKPVISKLVFLPFVCCYKTT